MRWMVKGEVFGFIASVAATLALDDDNADADDEDDDDEEEDVVALEDDIRFKLEVADVGGTLSSKLLALVPRLPEFSAQLLWMS